ncbi:MAG TPA: hypothetical protein PKA37_00930 [Planctomycetota bacterium]|nr:hypothetical protein [Planctomycetota bacterium]
MPSRRLIAVLIALLPSAVSAQGGGWWDDLFAAKRLTLSELVKDPVTYRGSEVILTVQIKGKEKIEETFLTSIQDAKHLRLSVWSEDAALWDKDVHDRPFTRIFAVRSSAAAERLKQAPLYSRFRISGRVIEVIKGEPWIEVATADPIPLQIDEPTLIHLVKARTLKNINRLTAAAVEFRSADHEGLPLAVRTMTMREEAECFHRIGKSDYALGRLRDALKLLPDEAETLALRDSIRSQIGDTSSGQ